MNKPWPMSSHQDNFSDVAKEQGRFTTDSRLALTLSAVTAFGEVAQCVHDYMPDMGKLSAQIGAFIGSLLVLTEHRGMADIRYILGNAYFAPNEPMDCSFSVYQASFFGSTEGRRLDNLHDTIDLIVLASTHLGQLTKAVCAEDDNLMFRSIAVLTHIMMVIASKHEISMDEAMERGLLCMKEAAETVLKQ
ncbi:MAG: hypothetical protein RSD49_06565 [Hafnia sp.]